MVVAGEDPLHYFKKYPGRFPLWHLKDMNMHEKVSIEFGKGVLDIPLMLELKELSGVEPSLAATVAISSGSLGKSDTDPKAGAEK